MAIVAVVVLDLDLERLPRSEVLTNEGVGLRLVETKGVCAQEVGTARQGVIPGDLGNVRRADERSIVVATAAKLHLHSRRSVPPTGVRRSYRVPLPLPHPLRGSIDHV